MTPQRISGFIPARDFRVGLLYPRAYYRFTLSATSTVWFERAGSESWIDVSLYNSSEQNIGRGDRFGPGEFRLGAGTYYIVFSSRSDSLTYYGLTLRTTDPATSARLTAPPTSFPATAQPLWHDDVIAAARAPRPDEKRQLQGTGGMLSAST